MRGWTILKALLAALALSLLAAEPAGAVGGVTFGMDTQQLADTGKGIEYGLPVVALGITLAHRDWTGLAQFAVLEAATVGVTYGIRQFIKKPSPDGTEPRSFPSQESAYGSGAEAYLWGRYGWEYGVPAFVVKQAGNYFLSRAKKHKFTDGLAVTLITHLMSPLLVNRYHSPVRVEAYAAADGTPMLSLAMPL